MRDFSPSMLLYGMQPLFRTNFHRCHALLSFVTSSLASPINAAAFELMRVRPKAQVRAAIVNLSKAQVRAAIENLSTKRYQTFSSSPPSVRNFGL